MWSLLRIALRPFKIYCAFPPITSQLVVFLWQTVEIGPLGHVRVVEALQNFVQKCDPVTLLGIHIHIVIVTKFGTPGGLDNNNNISWHMSLLKARISQPTADLMYIFPHVIRDKQ